MMADRKRVEPLLRTARGQLDGVLRMIDENRYCMDIVTQLQAVESLVHKAQREVLRAHLNGCVRDAFENGDEQAREQKIDEIIKLIEKGGYDLMVIGSRGLSGIKAYLGSVSHKVLNGSKVSVLIAK